MGSSTPNSRTETAMPECEKLSAVAPKSQAIGEFLDWLKDKGVFLATEHVHVNECFDEDAICICGASNGDLISYLRNTESMLAEFFGIDMAKVDRERCALLDAIRSRNEAGVK